MFRLICDFLFKYIPVIVQYRGVRFKLKINRDHFVLKNSCGHTHVFKYLDIKTFGVNNGKYIFTLLDGSQHAIVTSYAQKVYNKIYTQCVYLTKNMPVANVVEDGIVLLDDEDSLLLPMGELVEPLL